MSLFPCCCTESKILLQKYQTAIARELGGAYHAKSILVLAERAKAALAAFVFPAEVSIQFLFRSP